VLRFYPADSRREYGPLMVQVFRDVTRDAYHSQGWAGILLWWCATFFDLVLTVFEQRRKVRFEMSKSMFVQLAGIFLIVGGFCSAIAAFSQLQPDDHYTYYGIYQVLLWLLAPGFLLTGLGGVGLALRYDQALGTPGRWTLYLSSFGMLVMTVGLVATQIQDTFWNIWMVGGLIHTIGLTAFGLLHVRKPALPVFRALPLQIAAGWLVLWLGVPGLFPQSTAHLLSFFMFLGMGLAWLGIGLAVHRQPRDTVLATA
jgi:hypothetical protein